jgi:hypothetical protein
LLLDEMYPMVIAQQLRSRGHDVSAVTERPELRSLPDTDVFAVAQQERRAIVSENIADFSTIADAVDQSAQVHYGLVLIDPIKFPRGRESTIGRLVVALDELLEIPPADEAASLRIWL